MLELHIHPIMCSHVASSIVLLAIRWIDEFSKQTNQSMDDSITELIVPKDTILRGMSP